MNEGLLQRAIPNSVKYLFEKKSLGLRLWVLHFHFNYLINKVPNKQFIKKTWKQFFTTQKLNDSKILSIHHAIQIFLTFQFHTCDWFFLIWASPWWKYFLKILFENLFTQIYYMCFWQYVYLMTKLSSWLIDTAYRIETNSRWVSYFLMKPLCGEWVLIMEKLPKRANY